MSQPIPSMSDFNARVTERASLLGISSHELIARAVDYYLDAEIDLP